MKLIPAFALTLSTLVIANTAFASANCPAYPTSEHIPQKVFEQALAKRGFDIKTFKISGNCYEMYAISRKGKKVEMYFDMKTGKIVKQEIE